ncbi:MAG: hypothetical protein A3A83_02120 [Candidatus Doudnabacteria bacterium RIFCSPLOWO2_01_FULL_48_57]|nr:MAG: hypothetical protein A3A83_02120 [Candidatus Doudnabacteria bacterium RIFCSPLOWO2_01_FULL_48_57]
MRILDNDIEKIQELFRKSFGIELTKDQALEKGLALLSIFKITYRPITENEWAGVKRRRNKNMWT